jgi:hypothetical protein
LSIHSYRSQHTDCITEEEKAVAKKEKDERKAAEKAEKEDRRKSVEIDGKPEKKSLLSRLASKRKSRNVSKDETDGAVAGTTAGTAAAITPVATRDVADTRESAEVPDAGRNSADVEVLGAPISASGSKDSSVLKNKPNLERYITNLDTSSESSDDDEVTRVRKRDKRQRSGFLSKAKADDDDIAATEETESPVVAAVSPVRSRSIDLPAENASTRATKSMDLDGATTTTSDLPLTDEAEIIANRAVTAPVDAPRHLATVIPDDDDDKPRESITADTIAPPRESTASSHPDLEQEKAQDGKTIRGFFSKLRNRASSKPSAREPGSFGGKNKASDKDIVVPTSSNARPASASSFDRYRASAEDSPTRGRKKSADLSSISSDSSGLDEDDFVGGRTGRMARAEKGTGLGAPMTTTTKTRKGVRSDDDDSDQFEEARDHFDEGLAPKPNFAGQAKSASPARETKFHEEV